MSSTIPKNIGQRRLLLSMYRQLMSQANLLKKKSERVAVQKEIRDAFRQKDHEGKHIEELMEKANSKLSYLKIVTPRRQRDNKVGKSQFIFKDGKLVEGSNGIPGRTLRAGIYEDDIKRHQYLMERQHFMHRK